MRPLRAVSARPVPGRRPARRMRSGHRRREAEQQHVPGRRNPLGAGEAGPATSRRRRTVRPRGREEYLRRVIPEFTGIGVVELLGEFGLVRGDSGQRRPTRPQVWEEASPSLVSPRAVRAGARRAWTASRTGPGPASKVEVLMPFSMTCSPMPRSRRSAPRVTWCSSERESRSNRVTFSVSPSRSS